jgi:hypothetical protein
MSLSDQGGSRKKVINNEQIIFLAALWHVPKGAAFVFPVVVFGWEQSAVVGPSSSRFLIIALGVTWPVQGCVPYILC